MNLKNTYRIRLSDNDLLILKQLKSLRIKPTTFIRKAFREKIENELPKVIEAEKKRIDKIKCPF